MGKGRVAAADIRFGIINAADPALFIKLLQKRAGVHQLFGFQIYPDPAQSVDPRQQIIPPFALPACNITVRGVQMPAKIPAAFAATGAAGSYRFFRMSVGMQPLLQNFEHTSPLSGAGP